MFLRYKMKDCDGNIQFEVEGGGGYEEAFKKSLEHYKNTEVGRFYSFGLF